MHVDKWVEWDNSPLIDKSNHTQAIRDTGKALEIDMIDDTPEGVEIKVIFNNPITYRITEEICTIALQWAAS